MTSICVCQPVKVHPAARNRGDTPLFAIDVISWADTGPSIARYDKSNFKDGAGWAGWGGIPGGEDGQPPHQYQGRREAGTEALGPCIAIDRAASLHVAEGLTSVISSGSQRTISCYHESVFRLHLTSFSGRAGRRIVMGSSMPCRDYRLRRGLPMMTKGLVPSTILVFFFLFPSPGTASGKREPKGVCGRRQARNPGDRRRFKLFTRAGDSQRAGGSRFLLIQRRFP